MDWLVNPTDGMRKITVQPASKEAHSPFLTLTLLQIHSLLMMVSGDDNTGKPSTA